MSLPAAPRILFFADAGRPSGASHVMRCLTLARALAERGAQCAFVESRAAAPVLRRFGWPTQTLLAMVGAETLADLLAWGMRFADNFEADLVVVDHPSAGAGEERRLRGAGGGRRIAVIDDLADRAHDCDLLLDCGFGRRREHYAGLLEGACVLLLGPDHALVRPGFAEARPRALSRRARHEPVRRVLVGFGLADAPAELAAAVTPLVDQIGGARLDVVLGPDASGFEPLRALGRRDPRVRLHDGGEDLVTLGVEADVAVGGGGLSLWERACIGLPTATAALDAAQAPMVQRLFEARAVIGLDARAPDFAPALGDALRRLIDDRDLRWELSRRSAELCDGRGAARVADALFDLLR